MSMCTIIRPPTSVLGLGSFWLDNLQYFCQRWRASDTFARSLRFDGFCAAFFNCHPRFSRTDSLTTLRLTLVQVCLGITVVQLSPRFKFTTAGTFVFEVAWYYCESKITSSKQFRFCFITPWNRLPEVCRPFQSPSRTSQSTLLELLGQERLASWSLVKS